MKQNEPAHMHCYGRSSEIHIFSENDKVENTQHGVLLPVSEEGCEETRACWCVCKFSREGSGWLGEEVGRRFAFYSISFCISLLASS